jgi:hypothetical protein
MQRCITVSFCFNDRHGTDAKILFDWLITIIPPVLGQERYYFRVHFVPNSQARLQAL